MGTTAPDPLTSTRLECGCYFQPHSIPVWVKSKCPSSLNLALNTRMVSGSALSPDLAILLANWATAKLGCSDNILSVYMTSYEHCVRILCAKFTSCMLAAHIWMHMHKQDVKRMGREIWNIWWMVAYTHSLNTQVISGITHGECINPLCPDWKKYMISSRTPA